uniref:Uncharacterized protein n=1 Tax=Urocitellus parryii TaxID=9999 RepID=A0A8D2KLA4_UROPR
SFLIQWAVCGTTSMDQYLNIKLTSMLQTLGDILTLSVKNCFIQRSVVHYVQLPADKLDVQLLQDAVRMNKEALKP